MAFVASIYLARDSANNEKHIAWCFCAAHFIWKTNTWKLRRRQNIIKRTHSANAEFCTKNRTNTHANTFAREQSRAGFAYVWVCILYLRQSRVYTPVRWAFLYNRLTARSPHILTLFGSWSNVVHYAQEVKFKILFIIWFWIECRNASQKLLNFV